MEGYLRMRFRRYFVEIFLRGCQKFAEVREDFVEETRGDFLEDFLDLDFSQAIVQCTPGEVLCSVRTSL